jgi:hypothetical protein
LVPLPLEAAERLADRSIREGGSETDDAHVDAYGIA